MENRFENLYGYVQRSLVKNILKELGSDESMTIGILLYNAHVDSFYYEGTVKNPLLFPFEASKPFKEKSIWNFELMYYLARYFAKGRTKGYIAELIDENSMLARNNASYYAIAFDRYDDLKVEWSEWLRTLNESYFSVPFNPVNDELRPVLSQVFHFANYLLTLIAIPAYRTSFLPGKGSFIEHIYRAVTGQLINDTSGLIDLETAEMPPPDSGITWSARPDSLIKYAELTLVLELCFKLPLKVPDKISLIQSIIENRLERGQSFQLTVMAKPLFYNGEFQGIIYVAKAFAAGNFSKNDFSTFRVSILNFHIQSIIHTSRFDTARIFLETITDTDLQLQIHPVIKALSIQHIFSASPFGIVINAGDSVYIRYRENSYMRSELTDLQHERLLSLFKNDLDFDIEDVMLRNNHYWHDMDTQHIRSFKWLLKTFFEVSEDLNVSSFTCLKFTENEKPLYYVLFNLNHTETVRGEVDNAVKQSYALRTHSNISKLTDTYVASKRLTDIQNNLLKDLQLGLLHEQKSFLASKVIKPLDEIVKMGPKKQISKKVNEIKEECFSAVKRFDDFIKVVVEQSNDRVHHAVNKKQIEDIFKFVAGKYKNKLFKISWDTSFIGPTHHTYSYPYTIQFILDELVSNAEKQYSSPEGQLIPKREIKIVARPTMTNNTLIGFAFEVTNTGTRIPDSMIECAGKERISNGANSSTGFGFYFIQLMLKRILPNPVADGKYFTIRNIPEGVEVKFYVLYKPVRR